MAKGNGWLALCLLLAILACRAGQTQLAPTVTPGPVSTASATIGPTLPAGTISLSPVASPTTPPTDLPPQATPTLAITLPPNASPTPAGEPLTIIAPSPGQTLLTGSTLTVSGQIQPGQPHVVNVQLLAAGRVLAESHVTLSDSETSWQTLLVVPESLAGPSTLQASLEEDGPMVVMPLYLSHPEQIDLPSVQLSYPVTHTLAVAGYTLFFSGRAQKPTDNTITIALLTENCQNVVAQQHFTVGGGGNWYGYVILPDTTIGPACAIAYFGTIDQPGWKGAQVPLTVLAKNDPAAVGLYIGFPAGREIAPGQTLTLFGSAYNVPNSQLTIQLIIGTQVIVEGLATVDRFGYWEIDLTLPAGTSNAEAQLKATYGDPAGEMTIPIRIVSP